MKNIRIDFRNFWSSFSENEHSIYFAFIKHFLNINGYNLIIDKKDPQIIFYSVFGKQQFDNSSIKVLFCLENIHQKHYSQYKNNIHHFDFVLSFDEDVTKNMYKIPYWFISGNLYKKNNDYEIIKSNQTCIKNKTKNISLISKNPENLRVFLFNAFKKLNVVVDCPGEVCNNMPNIGRSRLDKINFLSDYIFNICPENSWYYGYNTEKLYEALISGCLPIYWGCEDSLGEFYNREKIFLINKNLSNIDYVVNKVAALLKDTTKINRYLNIPSFGINRISIIEDTNLYIKDLFKKILEKA